MQRISLVGNSPEAHFQILRSGHNFFLLDVITSKIYTYINLLFLKNTSRTDKDSFWNASNFLTEKVWKYSYTEAVNVNHLWKSYRKNYYHLSRIAATLTNLIVSAKLRILFYTMSSWLYVEIRNIDVSLTHNLLFFIT